MIPYDMLVGRDELIERRKGSNFKRFRCTLTIYRNWPIYIMLNGYKKLPILQFTIFITVYVKFVLFWKQAILFIKLHKVCYEERK